MKRTPCIAAVAGTAMVLAGAARAQPANDRCGGAVPVQCGAITFGTTDGATTDSEFPGCDTGITSPGVWYSIAGTGGLIHVDTCGAGTEFDTKLHAFRGECETAVCITGNDDSPDCDPSMKSKIEFATDAGVQYLILVSGFGGATGNFELNAVCDAIIEDCNNNGIPDEVDIADGTSADCNINGIPDECENNYATFTFGRNHDIPDQGTVSDTRKVRLSGEIGDVNVRVEITHTFIGDLRIELAHEGTAVQLWDRQCINNDDMNVVFDDLGDPVLCETPTEGTFVPVEPLAAFNGGDMLGDWTITVSDDAALDFGKLTAWELMIGVPILRDCNDNCIPDDEDVRNGTSADRNGNGVPDECESRCDLVTKLQVRCKPKGGAFRIVGRIAAALPEGEALTLVLDGEDSKEVTLDSAGLAKAKWRIDQAGGHDVCLADCGEGGLCRSAVCE